MRFPNASDDPRNHDNKLSAFSPQKEKTSRARRTVVTVITKNKRRNRVKTRSGQGAPSDSSTPCENVMKGKVEYLTDGMESAKDMKRFEMQEDLHIAHP